jgi:hypothetical protein
MVSSSKCINMGLERIVESKIGCWRKGLWCAWVGAPKVVSGMEGRCKMWIWIWIWIWIYWEEEKADVNW